ncbi:MAG: hypothetical protein EOP04_22435 [Proteobacteria bacterium]|nr:MAG: hypothetical protein EOP04_22435 [Pseudomonadota bacterium]
MQNNAVMFFAKFIEKELGIIYAEFNYFQLNNRLEEAAEIYKTVEVHFKNDQLRKQAASLNKTLQVE